MKTFTVKNNWIKIAKKRKRKEASFMSIKNKLNSALKELEILKRDK